MEKIENAVDRYEAIKKLGYVIDIRGTRPTLIKGMQVWEFQTNDRKTCWEICLEHAEMLERKE